VRPDVKNRSRVIVAGAVALVSAFAAWVLHSGCDDRHADEKARDSAGAAYPNSRERVDVRKRERASIAGTIRDEAGKPIAAARVCADASTSNLGKELVRDSRCTATDAQGAYRIGGLYAAEYEVAAVAREYLPYRFAAESNGNISFLELRAGENLTGIDIVLVRGAVEVTGVVSDVSGGPIAHASVRAVTGVLQPQLWPALETDDSGKFSLWVKPGDVSVRAFADGYADGSDLGRAPGVINILLTPESSLAGTVVDANTGVPVAGVRVEEAGVENGNSDITDDQGHFHLTRITPGRYALVARSPHGYGHSDGSSQVGLGQHVTGVVVKLHPAYQIAGRVVEPGAGRATCRLSSLYLRQADPVRKMAAIRDTDGSLHVDGVLPGTYDVAPLCAGFVQRDMYHQITITNTDVANVEWEVDAGAEVHGRVLMKSGSPVQGATILARSVGGSGRERDSSGTAMSRRDGAYEIKGLKQGSYELSVLSEEGSSPMAGWKIEVQTTIVDKDLVLDDVGTIKGIVVDSAGKPVAGADVSSSLGGLPTRSSEDGTFTLGGVRLGAQHVFARRGWSDESPRSASDHDATHGVNVTVTAGQIASVRLVVDSQSAAIKGTCVDTDGKPITDAYVSAARESDVPGSQRLSVTDTQWSWDNKPILTSTDGTFEIGRLSPGPYTVRAERKGGGEAIAEHVTVGTSIALVFEPTGQIDGLVHGSASSPDELAVTLRNDATGYWRREEFFRTAGNFTIRDLPAGHFTITASAGGGEKQVAIDLARGEHKRGVDIELADLVTLTGRVVELGTNRPVAGMRMFATVGASDGRMISISSSHGANVSDETGRFTLRNVPIGAIQLHGVPTDYTSDFSSLSAVRRVDGDGTIDVGDLGVAKRRLKQDDIAGELGVRWVDQPVDTPPEQQHFKVSWIDPNGAAAKTELRVGDIVTSIDGFDVTGANHSQGYTLMRAPAGTTLILGLARGLAVSVILRGPS
jgi:protocatechuate 3,4-dioxygenase beta subunit